MWNPTLVLRDILDAISRAKDELVTPVRYRALSDAMLAKAEAAGDEEKTKAAEKCLEVADVYDLYERLNSRFVCKSPSYSLLNGARIRKMI